MNSIKCKSCGLKNFPSDFECRRCGHSFVVEQKKSAQRPPRRFSVFSLLVIVFVLGLVYYFYNGVQGTMGEINSNEAKRVQSQPKERPATPGLSRSEYDRQRSGHYGDAVKNSPSLEAHKAHIKETEKAMQQVSNSK
jgi:ribosomal protein L37E